MYFNPRSPRGGATGAKVCRCGSGGISIHAPHEGERPSRSAQLMRIGTFQSTLPTRGSDLCSLPSLHPSSHFNPRSPRGGATASFYFLYAVSRYFNPRSPRGGATLSGRLDRPLIVFQSTLPTRGSDNARIRECKSRRRISIHAPHEGERLEDIQRLRTEGIFQSTLPTRGSDYRLIRRCIGTSFCTQVLTQAGNNFNPRSPRGGATSTDNDRLRHGGISIHAPHEGERPKCHA